MISKKREIGTIESTLLIIGYAVESVRVFRLQKNLDLCKQFIFIYIIRYTDHNEFKELEKQFNDSLDCVNIINSLRALRTTWDYLMEKDAEKDSKYIPQPFFTNLSKYYTGTSSVSESLSQNEQI